MYSIYFENRNLAVCSNTEQSINDPNAVLYIPGSFPKIASLPYMFDQSPGIKTLYIKSENEESTLEELFTNLTQINAGGGLVTNKNGEYLIIFRHGRWDLPKGKQEPGEDIRSSAVREVEEECGLNQVTISRHLCDTYHTYHRNDLFWIKRTQWFKMEYNGNGTSTIPQLEEGIEKAIWVNRCELADYMQNTYPSIIEVFEKSGITLNL